MSVRRRLRPFGAALALCLLLPMLAFGQPPDRLKVSDNKRFLVTSDGSYALVYVPTGRPFKVRMDKISGDKVKAWWFNPRDGAATAAGDFENKGERDFVSPDAGDGLDWVLVLDDVAHKFPPPGKAK